MSTDGMTWNEAMPKQCQLLLGGLSWKLELIVVQYSNAQNQGYENQFGRFAV